MKESGYRAAEGTVAVHGEAAVRSAGGSEAIRLSALIRASPLVDANGNVVSEGVLFNPSYYFRHLNGKLMLFSAQAICEEVLRPVRSMALLVLLFSVLPVLKPQVQTMTRALTAFVPVPYRRRTRVRCPGAGLYRAGALTGAGSSRT